MQYAPFAIATALILAASPAATAQVQIHGRVIDDASATPIVGVAVTLLDNGGRRLGRQLTDSAGEFRFVAGEGAHVRLSAEHVGYRRVTSEPLHLGTYTVYRLEIRLAEQVVLLAPLEVVARSRSVTGPTLAGFEVRRATGTGWFLTRPQIEAIRPRRVTDLLLEAPGVLVIRRTVHMARAGGCPAQVFIDGFHANRAVTPPTGRRAASSGAMFPLDEMVSPGEVQAIEVYQGLSRVPAEYLTPDAACGVVLIWTRREN